MTYQRATRQRTWQKADRADYESVDYERPRAGRPEVEQFANVPSSAMA